MEGAEGEPPAPPASDDATDIGQGNRSQNGHEKGADKAQANPELARRIAQQVEEARRRQQLEAQAALLGLKLDDSFGKPKEHKFWSTQPVPQNKEEGEIEDDQAKDVQEIGTADGDDSGTSANAQQPIGPLEVKTVEEVRATPYALPKGFEWCNINVESKEELTEAYHLLSENYVEDDDAMFRFDYPVPFLEWALKPPGFYRNWHVGVRQTNNKNLLAMITGVPAKVHVHGETIRMAEINFLCVHKKLRSKRLAPVLIKEVTRRVNLENMWQAVYTAGVRIPTPLGAARYYHRSLNPQKLVSIGFSSLAPRMTMKRLIRLNKLPEEPQIPLIRPMEMKDVPGVCKILLEHQRQFKIWIEFDEEEVAHWLLPRPDVVYAFVVTNESGEVTDFCSFYNLPSTVIGNDKYSHLKAAYSFYNVANTISFRDLMYNALILAHKNNFDVFNALNLMENGTILEDLMFGKGDGVLNYYFFNYNAGRIEGKDIGVVLL